MDSLNVIIKAVTPNLASFATPYSSGDVLGSLNTIAAAVSNQGGPCKLKSLVVLDAANQKQAIDLIFLNDVPASSFGADNAAYALADSDLSKVLGRISVLTTDYVSSSTNNAEATLRNLELLFQAIAGSKNIYMIAVVRGAATYGSATDLIIKLGLEQK